ncbi:Uncharacterised protein [Enterobacter cloacae]|uniref:Uncharacterized protein n=1 Tax=Enterobacter cloacae TaxID=550 RepID=A0A377M8J2_ENTCL|nr:Uncharacterised protein [Enterobacter cloacae]
MNGIETRAQNLIATIEMMQIRARIIATGVAIALGIERTGVTLMLRVTDFHHAIGNKQMTVTCVTGWHDAVEHIDAAAHTFNQIFWLTHTHQVTGFIRRDLRADMFQNTVHVFLRLTHS